MILYIRDAASGLSVRANLLAEKAPANVAFLGQYLSVARMVPGIHAMWTGPEISCPIPAAHLARQEWAIALHQRMRHFIRNRVTLFWHMCQRGSGAEILNRFSILACSMGPARACCWSAPVPLRCCRSPAGGRKQRRCVTACLALTVTDRGLPSERCAA